MKHKTWFRLVIKAIGVLLIGLGIPGVLQAVMGVIWWIQESQRFSGTQQWWWGILQPIGQLGFDWS